VAYSSEIDKLEKRQRENPKGRNFAPLADAYRKAGELDRAIELCRKGLQEHPDYISAHIVYGRCLIDKQDDPAAEQVFRRVLELDPENILGLRILAEVAERSGQPEQSVEWLTRLLSADPMNGDAAEALARVRAKASAAARPAAAPAPELERTAPRPGLRVTPPPARRMTPSPGLAAIAEAPTTEMSQSGLGIVHEEAEPVTPDATGGGAPLSGEIEPFDGTLDFTTVAREGRRTEGLELEQSVEPELLVVDGLAPTQYESALHPPSDAPAVEGLVEAIGAAEPSVELPLILPEDVQPGRPSAPRLSPPPPPAPRRSPTAGVLALSDDDGAADTTALSQAEPVVTETMAELYVRQGHTEEALRVYHALLEQRPGDPGLRGKIARLTGAGGRPSGATGQSARDFLRSVLHGLTVSGLGRGAGTEVVTAPPARRMSLEAVFGEGTSAPAAGPVPAAAPAVPTTTGGFSFDDFFAPAASGERGAAEGPPAGAAGAATEGPPRVGGEDRADLDEFQRWLQGLRA